MRRPIHFGADLRVGSTIAVRQTASGGYERIGPAASCGWPAVYLLGLSILLLGVLAVCVRTGARRVSRALWVLLGSSGAVMLVSALIGGVAGMTEAC
jgi:hypothetical protein